MAKALRFTLLWAGALTLLHFTLFVCGSALPSSADAPLKAALVTLVQEDDLTATLFSIQQIEDKFNNRHLYDWVFFSVQGLPDRFKELTSNATNATCIFEVIPEENWNMPGWTDHSQLSDSHEINSDCNPKSFKPIADIRQMKRWSSAPFANERRLRNYEWFWRVEPGASLSQDIPFDVFRYMRDNGIAYGFNRAVLGQANLYHLSRVKSFIDKHPELLHKEADITWLIENGTGLAIQSGSSDDSSEGLVDEGSDKLGSRDETAHDSNTKNEGKGASWIGGSFATWLSEVYGNSLYPTFDIGSLAFFRSPHHVAFFDHLDSAGDFQYRRVDDVPVHSLSASMFLPRESVWNFRAQNIQLRTQLGLQPTGVGAIPNGDQRIVDYDNTDSGNSVKHKNDPEEEKKSVHENWESMTPDVSEQSGNPHLISGNTWMGKDVADEANGCSFFWFWEKVLAEFSGFAGYGWETDFSCLQDD
ncbi:nucleotide-diphospho-sugar transferase [Fusarium redolens]|uniref:Nucleotide-diphospho-sugar transferase n=1 Tax=Fusarium redolens TaxID=48865 RepID=A0A9P9KLE8_FUSRE|nr:nucleotide-diphospho-sugar transferase [Fusarium redolens]KAH7261506.1 nucleotide-diphospho-sugar transferase [Fusarium redolens]